MTTPGEEQPRHPYDPPPLRHGASGSSSDDDGQGRPAPGPGHDEDSSWPSTPASQATPPRGVPAPPAQPTGVPGFPAEQGQETYDDFYRQVYGEAVPPQAPSGQSGQRPDPPGWVQGYPGADRGDMSGYQAPAQQQGYPSQGYPSQGYGPQQGRPIPPGPPYDPRLPAGAGPYYPASVPDRESGLALGLTAVGFLGVAGLQYFYIGKIGKGVAYLLTAGWFGIGTVVSLFTINDEVIRTNDERRRGLR